MKLMSKDVVRRSTSAFLNVEPPRRKMPEIDIEFDVDDELPGYRIQAMVKTVGQTGVEMEALTAVSVAALTLYDMAKAVQKSMQIESIRLIRKTGGKSGDYTVG